MNELKEHWIEIINTVNENRPSLGMILDHSDPDQIKGNVLTIQVTDVSKFNISILDRNRLAVERTIQDRLGHDLRCKFVLNETRDINEQKLKQQTEKESLEANSREIVRKVIDKFQGELLK